MFCLDRISVDFLLGSFFGSVCAFLSFFWGECCLIDLLDLLISC